MLKIKESVDLKELEKYGFVKDGLLDYQKRVQNITIIYTTHKHKELYLFIEKESSYINGKELDTLYDLIKDGLVVKVDE